MATAAANDDSGSGATSNGTASSPTGTRDEAGRWAGPASACGGVVRRSGVVVTGASATAAAARRSALANDATDGAVPEWQATSPTWRISRRFLGLNGPADPPGLAAGATRGKVDAPGRTAAAGDRGAPAVTGGEEKVGAKLDARVATGVEASLAAANAVDGGQEEEPRSAIITEVSAVTGVVARAAADGATPVAS